MPKVWLNTLVRLVAEFGIIVGRCNSTLGRNTLLCCSHFGWKFSDFVSGSIDLSNCTLLRRHHKLIDSCDWHTVQFLLADRTNGRAIATLLRLSSSSSSFVVCLWRYVMWLNGASESKSYYGEPIGSRIWVIDWYQNEWPWPLFRGRIKVTSTVALLLTLNISETVRDRGLVPKDYQ